MAGERYIEDLVIPASGSLTLAPGATVSGSLVQGPASATDNAVARYDATTGKLIQDSVVTIADTTGNMAGVGTLNTRTIANFADGPGSSTDNTIPRFDGTGGKTLQTSGVVVDDSNNISGVGTLGCGTVTSTGNLISGTSGYVQGKTAVYIGSTSYAGTALLEMGGATGQSSWFSMFNGNDRRWLIANQAGSSDQWQLRRYTGASSDQGAAISVTSADGTVTIATPLKVTGIRAVTATGSASAQEIAHGTYTPTLTNGSNCAASTAYVCNTTRVGNTVTVTGRINVDPTSAATLTTCDVSLPVASAMTVQDDLTGQGNTFGSAATPTYQPTFVANYTNDRATMYYKPSDNVADDILFSFTYIVK